MKFIFFDASKLPYTFWEEEEEVLARILKNDRLKFVVFQETCYLFASGLMNHDNVVERVIRNEYFLKEDFRCAGKLYVPQDLSTDPSIQFESTTCDKEYGYSVPKTHTEKEAITREIQFLCKKKG